MKTNEELIKIHDALVDKVAASCAIEGSARTAVEIGNDIIAYGKLWLKAFSDDGKVDDVEADAIKVEFSNLVEKRVKNLEFGMMSPVTWAYRGFVKDKIENGLGIRY